MSEKLYWDNAYETKFRAKVIDIRPESIVLDKTIFYPESGNQASDRGTIKFESNEFDVTNVSKEENDILHHLSPDFKGKIKVGDIVEGEIDWNYRYGIMKAHSSQHIFSAVTKKKFNIETIRAKLEFEDVFIQLSNELDYTQLNEIIAEVNKICSSHNLNIVDHLKTKVEAEKIASKIRSIIPDESEIRLMEIEGLDLVCCGGTHIKNTSEIGMIYIYDFKKGKDVRYSVGEKAVVMSSKYNLDLINLANKLNSPLEKTKNLFEKRLELLTSGQEQQKDLSIRLLEFISKTPYKIINDISLFFIDFDFDIKLLNKMQALFPQNSLIIVKFDVNKIRILTPGEVIDSNNLLQILMKSYGGKGGGTPKSAQGNLTKMPEDILSEIATLLETKNLTK
ncbi:MAG: alanyl-tRNA editing protein [Promethearchaeota archaeon]